MDSSSLVIKDSLIDPNIYSAPNIEIPYFRNDEDYRYKVWIYLEGPQIFFIDYVIYTLPSSFNITNKTVSRSLTNPNCSFFIWTNGVFNVQATIFLKSGELITTEHYLSFDRDIQADNLKFRSSSSME